MNLKNGIIALSIISCATSCTNVETFDGLKIPEKWAVESIDPNMDWKTSTTMKLNVSTSNPCDIIVHTVGQKKQTILTQAHLESSGVISFDVPIGLSSNIGITSVDKSNTRRTSIFDLKEAKGKSTIDFNASTIDIASTGSSIDLSKYNSSIIGESIVPDNGYVYLGGWAWDDIENALPESQAYTTNIATNAMYNYEMVCKGELQPDGTRSEEETLYLTTIYGNTSSKTGYTIGYYTHCGDYTDLEFHPIVKAFDYDIINGKYKMQYMLNNDGTWRNCNTMHQDADQLPTVNPTNCERWDPNRVGDDISASRIVHRLYKGQITAVRGLAFPVTLKKGQYYGFYITHGNPTQNGSTNQKENMTQYNTNLADVLLPGRTNFSNAKLNGSQEVGSNNIGVAGSSFTFYNGNSMIGFDDNFSGAGDRDCNDIVFAFVDKYGRQPDIDFTDETKEENPDFFEDPDPEPKTQTWNLLFEDSGVKSDFDYNDVVLRIMPNFITRECQISLLAVGGNKTLDLYYDNEFIGEVHDLIGIQRKNMVNTIVEEEIIEIDPKVIHTIPWNKETTIEEVCKKIALHAYYDSNANNDHGAGDSQNRMITIESMMGEGNNVPEAFYVPGEWEWPKEKISIFEAYPEFRQWTTNKETYKEWYLHPADGKFVNYRFK